MPAMKIAGLCLPLKPQKERSYNALEQLDLVISKCLLGQNPGSVTFIFDARN
jgi:hypothetical protein